MDIGLLGIDLDGTLLSSSKSVSERDFEALRELASQGAFIVPVTGRPLAGVPDEVLRLPGVSYIITSNGAMTYRVEKDKNPEPVSSALIDNETAVKIFDCDCYPDIISEVMVDGVGYTSKYDFKKRLENLTRQEFISYLKRSRRTVDDVYDILMTGVDVENISFLSSRRIELEKLIKDIDVFEVKVLDGGTIIEVVSREANKGRALTELALKLGVSREATVSMGDSYNDADLLKAAGFSVAMGNACDDVKKLSHYVTADNDSSGVAEALKYIGNL